jgi:Asp-tRNA(Asn)/Glu-tRNA(Gln) amidotransferase A subunit family amidase
MAVELWDQDAISLNQAFKDKKLSVQEFLDFTFQLIKKSQLNAFCYLDEEAAYEQANKVDVNLPFGGVPFGVKELDMVKGWPWSEASLLFDGRVAEDSLTYIKRLKTSGAIFVGQTTASEFGGVNCTHTKIHGTTRNPWQLDRTPGGSSGGSAAAVAAGLIPIATGGDGGGSIRIPAGFCGLFGLKTTYGLIPKGPPADIGALTAVLGCLSRSVRDTARFLDVTSGYSTHDPLSLPKKVDWEKNLGSYELKGKTVAISPDLAGSAVVNTKIADMVEEIGSKLISTVGLKRVDVPSVKVKAGGMEWAAANLIGLVDELGDLYPAREADLTPEIMFGLNVAVKHYNMDWAVRGARHRRELNESMAKIFDEVDFLITSTNPDVAFNASGPLPTVVNGQDLIKMLGPENALGNNGALTIPANVYGNPGINLPIGQLDNLPVGMQVMARHHEDALLLDLASLFESHFGWPKVAPNSPV